MIVCGGVESGVQFKLGNVVTAYCKQLWDVGVPIADLATWGTQTMSLASISPWITYDS